MTLYHLTIDGQAVSCTPGQTILEAASQNGIHIPNLCYNGKVEPYGACGLCLVEIEGSPKLARACATKARDGMVVATNSKRAVAERKIALELLLSDHRGDCIAPCQLACPAQADCQGYVGLIAAGYPREALMLLKDSYPLPASLGRVCPHPCETACRRGLKEGPVAIAALKQYAADHDLASDNPFLPEKAPATGKKVAIVGGGPAGLTMGWFLAKAGHQATIYDMMPQAGGMLRYGIPEYRLPKAVLDEEIALIEQLGVTIIPNTKLGRDITLDQLRKENDAVYLAIGAWRSSGLGCPGEDVQGVIGGIDFLGQVALGQTPAIGDRVAIVGGGNTAMDACRTAKRLGAKEVYLLYRRTRAEMPAEDLEIAEAEEEGVQYKFLVAPEQVLHENGKVTGIRLQQMELGEPDASGRRRPVPIAGATEDLMLDTIIAAIGQQVVPEGCDGVELTKKQTIAVAEDTFATNLAGVFAGGDAINKGPGIAIAAIGHAKFGAQVIESYLAGDLKPYRAPYRVEKTNVTAADLPEVAEQPRQQLHFADPAERATNFQPVAQGFTDQEAKTEASRCLECGCFDVHECKLLAYAREYQVDPSRVAGETHKGPAVNDHPFIFRDPNKCVLCGLCVRTCSEVVGAGVLGLHDRGFDTSVESGFGTSLIEAGCKSCGQCVAVCPTGALQECQPDCRTIPLPTQGWDSVCNFCGLGCPTKVHAYGAAPVKVTPVEQGRLCRQGRFGWQASLSDQDLTPLIAEQPASYQQALAEAQRLLGQISPDQLGVVVSANLTNEELFLAKQFSSHLYSTNVGNRGLVDVLGLDGSTCSFDELTQTRCILAVNIDPASHYPMLTPRLKQALAQQASLYSIQPGDSSLDALATASIRCSDSIAPLQELVKALLDAGCTGGNAQGLAELQQSLASVQPGQQAKAIAQAYLQAEDAILLFDRSRTTAHAARLLAAMAVLSGHIGRERNGILQLRQSSNSQGLANLGIHHNLIALERDLAAGKVKGLLVMGQFLPANLAAQAQFRIVLDCQASPAFAGAEVFLPIAGFGGTPGTRTSCQNKVGRLTDQLARPQVRPGYLVLCQLLGQPDRSLQEVQQALAHAYPDYQGTFDGQKTFATQDGSPIRYRDGFATPDGLAHLQAAADLAGPLTKEWIYMEIPILRWLDLLQRHHMV